jgi:hypothetical protein
MTIDRPTAARLRLAACTATVLALVLCGCGQENRLTSRGLVRPCAVVTRFRRLIAGV